MTKKVFYIIGLSFLLISACRKSEGDVEVEIPDFNFPQTASFESSLSAYRIFEGTPSNLMPSEDFELLELSSVLFTDYAYKQRLLKIPEGTSITTLGDGSLSFPDGTVLTKTFFYFNDERDTTLGKRIIETRLEIKESGIWNIATYVWNESQTDAILSLDGHDVQVSWTNSQGKNSSTFYHVPTQNECMACHQSSSKLSPIGPTLLNLNRTVQRDSVETNQLAHLQSIGLLEQFSLSDIPQMVDYNNLNASLSERGRAYLSINCAHCHNPKAWDIPAEAGFDFRYSSPFELSGIQNGKDRISRNVLNQEMPFIGTTMMDEKGIALLVEYLNSL